MHQPCIYQLTPNGDLFNALGKTSLCKDYLDMALWADKLGRIFEA